MQSCTTDNIVFFDGHCNLCSGVVNFLLRRDKKEKFHYASLNSEAAKKYLSHTDKFRDKSSVVFYHRGTLYEKSSAVLHIFKQLPGLWPVLSIFLVVPRPLRDGVYNFISKNRYKWFDRKEQCYLPQKEVRHLFLP